MRMNDSEKLSYIRVSLPRLSEKEDDNSGGVKSLISVRNWPRLASRGSGDSLSGIAERCKKRIALLAHC